MAPRVVVRDVDKGAKALIRMLGKRGAHVTVGIHADDGAKTEKDSSRTVLEVGTYNEFGTKRIPERSFIRGWFDFYDGQNRVTLTRLMQGVVQQATKRVEKDDLIMRAMNKLGVLFVAQVQQRMAQGIPPPNAESTVRRKGSTTPLINFGQLRSSIRAVVHMVGGAS